MNARGVVVRVIDGDTVWVRVRVRLRRSAPDTGIEALRATSELEDRLPKGKRIQIAVGSVDGYGRIIADIIPDTSSLA